MGARATAIFSPRGEFMGQFARQRVEEVEGEKWCDEMDGWVEERGVRVILYSVGGSVYRLAVCRVNIAVGTILENFSRCTYIYLNRLIKVYFTLLLN